jgi:hypothetical protein
MARSLSRPSSATNAAIQGAGRLSLILPPSPSSTYLPQGKPASFWACRQVIAKAWG